MEPIFFEYPDWINEIAFKMGEHRANSMRGLDELKPEYVRPDKYHIIGALGELIFLLFCHTNKFNYESNKLFSDNAVIGYDVILTKGNLKHYIDVKTSDIESEGLSVNNKSHNKKNKMISMYVFVKLLGNNTCNIYRYLKSDIDNWDKRNKKWKNANVEFYFKEL